MVVFRDAIGESELLLNRQLLAVLGFAGELSNLCHPRKDPVCVRGERDVSATFDNQCADNGT